MIEAAANAVNLREAPIRLRDASARGVGTEFSYTLAAASLERRASQSLEAHGSRPQNSEAAQTAPQAESVPVREDSPSSDPSSRQPAPLRFSAADAAGASAPKTPPPMKIISAPVATALASPAAAPSSVAAPSMQARLVDASALRNVSAEKSKAAAHAAPTNSEPSKLNGAFAEILARRLEKSSVFDFRLDPPELGRVEGRLVINDDGKSVLSLTFDSQNAFDLFSRDEQALRLALQQAGLNFSAGDFVFAFEDRSRPTPGFAAGALQFQEASTPYEPAFVASWSGGAIDIRI